MGEDDGNGLNPWILRRENHIIQAKNVTVKEDAKPADEDEFVEILWMPLEEVMQKNRSRRNCGCEDDYCSTVCLDA